MHKVGIDFGRSAVKFTCNGAAVLEFPPLLSRASMTGPFISLGHSGLEVGLDGASWLVGEGAMAGLDSRWLTDEHKTGRDMLVMALAALGQMGVQGDVAVCTGVPAALWRSDGASLGDTLAGEHRYTLNGREREVRLADVMVLPEPMGSYFAAILGADGRVANHGLAAGPVAVVDIGYRTVDIILVDRGRLVEDVVLSTGSGVAMAFNRIYRLVASSIGVLSDGERAEVFASLVKSAPIQLKGQHIGDGLYERFVEARQEVAEQIVVDVRNALGGVKYKALLMTGGGAEWLRDILQPRFPGATWVEEARLANVRGFHRYASIQASSKARQQAPAVLG